MRISDWSSDVCSSDLTDGEAAGTEAEEEANPPQATAPEKAPREEIQAESTAPKGRVLASPAVRKRALDLGVDLALVRPAEGGRVRHGDLEDRKSVVSGKSVSVRVDLGGRRILEKQITNIHSHYHT